MRRLGSMIAHMIENETDLDCMVYVSETYVEIDKPCSGECIRIYSYAMEQMTRRDIVSVFKLIFKYLMDAQWFYGIEWVDVSESYYQRRWDSRNENCYVIGNFEMWL